MENDPSKIDISNISASANLDVNRSESKFEDETLACVNRIDERKFIGTEIFTVTVKED